MKNSKSPKVSTESPKVSPESYIILSIQHDVEYLEKTIKKQTDTLISNISYEMKWVAESLFKSASKKDFWKMVLEGEVTLESLIGYKNIIIKELQNAELMNSTSVMNNAITVWNIQIRQKLIRDLNNYIDMVEKA